MGAITYYGSDRIENIPSTIPLTDSTFNITARWNFTEIVATNFTVSSQFNVNSNATFNNNVTITGNKELTVGGDTLIKGNLYVNTLGKNKNTFDATNFPNGIVYPNPNTGEQDLVANGGGNIYAGRITGVSMAAQYHDLGERFAIDKEAPKGSIVALGGEKEIKLATSEDKVFGVIATNPAIRMNEFAGTDETHPFICWAGRIPCRVIGKVNKFDKIYLSDIAGVGSTEVKDSSKFVGIALTNKETEEEGTVEIVSRIQIME